MLEARVKLPSPSSSELPVPLLFLFFPRFLTYSSSCAVLRWFRPVPKRSSLPLPISPGRMSSMGKRCAFLVCRKTVCCSLFDERGYAPALPLDQFHECMPPILLVHFCAAVRVALP